MPRLMFVEDEQALTDTLVRFFSKEGFDVYIARSRSEAVENAARFPPDVVVLDVMLNEGPEPEFDGFAVRWLLWTCHLSHRKNVRTRQTEGF